MIIASTSTTAGTRYLEYLLPVLQQAFKENNITQLLFIPYARPGSITHDAYLDKVKAAFKNTALNVTSIHEVDNKQEAIMNAQAIFTGGGNTFLLVKMLHDLNLIPALRQAIYNGTFYLGTSAGSNICGLNMRTTNDMPIVQPSSFKTIGAIGYNINPHYLDPDPQSSHMGETRAMRIEEFHGMNSVPVVGLREGSWIRVVGNDEILKGNLDAPVFRKDKPLLNAPPGFNFATLDHLN